MLPPDERSRRIGHPTAPKPPDDRIAEGGSIVADQGDCEPDPRAIGDLLNAWLDIQMSRVDDLVDEAHSKVAAIPEWRRISGLVGELAIQSAVLQSEVAELKDEVAALKRGRR